MRHDHRRRPYSPPTDAAAATAPVPRRGRRRRRDAAWSALAVRHRSLVAALGAVAAADRQRRRLWLRFDSCPRSPTSPAPSATGCAPPGLLAGPRRSLIRILTGFALAAVVGVVAGHPAGPFAPRSPNVLGPLPRWSGPIPAIALVPVAILLFPTNEQGIVFITFTAAFFPILVSTRHAVRALPTIWEEAVRTMGGGRWDVLARWCCPGILPGVFGGLSVGIGVAWICVISAEMISGRLGVGYRTWQDYTVVDYPGVFVGMITIGVLGFADLRGVELRRPPGHPLAAARRGEAAMTAGTTTTMGMTLELRRPGRWATAAPPVVDGLDLTRAARRDPGPRPALRLRQVHACCARWPGCCAARGRMLADGAAVRGPSARPRPGLPGRRAAALAHRAVATSNCRWRCRASAGGRGARRGAALDRRGRPRPARAATCPRASPAACASACSWPAPSRARRAPS